VSVARGTAAAISGNSSSNGSSARASLLVAEGKHLDAGKFNNKHFIIAYELQLSQVSSHKVLLYTYK
jgi:hypothetical protein